jgi:hypothetical protein
MIRQIASSFRFAPAVLVVAAVSFAACANGSTFSFETLDNTDDPMFNQLLGINSLASPTIVGYFGDGTVVPNKGYSLMQPYTSQASYTNENFPGSVQTQVVGIAPTSTTTTVGFYIDGAGNNFGFVDQSGTFTSVSDPSTPVTGPTVNQLLGVNDNNQAVGFYLDALGNSQAYLYNLVTKSFTAINLPGSFNATSTTATGINDAGVITGYFTNAMGATLGFIDDGGTFTSYNDPSGSDTMFLGINSSDQVVGSYVDGSGETDGLLFSLGSHTFQTVDDPLASPIAAFGVTGTTINGINNAGDLVGFFSDGNNVDGFLAVPTPEPTLIGLLLLGVAFMIGAYRHSKRVRTEQ